MHKKEIKQFMNENGNQNFTHKELIWWVIKTQDENFKRIIDKLENKVDMNTFKWVIGVLGTLIFSLFGYIIRGNL